MWDCQLDYEQSLSFPTFMWCEKTGKKCKKNRAMSCEAVNCENSWCRVRGKIIIRIRNSRNKKTSAESNFSSLFLFPVRKVAAEERRKKSSFFSLLFHRRLSHWEKNLITGYMCIQRFNPFMCSKLT